jgi:RNA polymerase sigma factor (sigma-70 family)
VRSQCALAHKIALAASSQSRHAAAAEDIAQDVVLRLLRKLELEPQAFPSDAALAYWVNASTRGRIMDIVDGDSASADRATSWLEESLPARRVAEHPATYTLVREMGGRTGDALTDMPDRRRESFLDSREDGLTVVEIAAKQGVTPATVRKQLQYATRDLAIALGDYVNTPPEDGDEWKIRPRADREAVSDEEGDDE